MKTGATPTRRRRPPPKTSSERGRKFRARQREYENLLVRHVATTREQVLALERSRLLRLEPLLHARHFHTGSLQLTIREFFTLFRNGLPAARDHECTGGHTTSSVRWKESYMRNLFDPHVSTGDERGVQAVIDQWRRYTTFHDRFHLDASHITVVGPTENPEFRLHATLTVRISHTTLEKVFPRALHDHALMHQVLHRVVNYDIVVRMRFAAQDDLRITHFDVDIDFVNGLRRVCESLEQVATLLDHARISPSCLLQDTVASSPPLPIKDQKTELLVADGISSIHELPTGRGSQLQGAMMMRSLARGRRPRPMTSAERGRQFRARERKRLHEAQASVAAIHQEIQSLYDQFTWLYNARVLQDQDNSKPDRTMALASLIHELIHRFTHGLQRTASDATRRQEAFLRDVMHPEITTGDLVGVDAILDQWRVYTAAHARFKVVLRQIEFVGSSDDPTAVVSLDVCTRWSERTLRTLFPHFYDTTQSKTTLPVVERLLAQEIVYKVTTRYQFCRENKIYRESVALDLVASLLQASLSMDEVEQLLARSQFTPFGTVRSPVY